MVLPQTLVPESGTICLHHWISNRVLRNFLSHYAEACWGDIVKQVTLLGIFTLLHQSADGEATVWNQQDLASLVDYIEKEHKFPDRLAPDFFKNTGGTPHGSRTPDATGRRGLLTKPPTKWRQGDAGVFRGRGPHDRNAINAFAGSRCVAGRPHQVVYQPDEVINRASVYPAWWNTERQVEPSIRVTAFDDDERMLDELRTQKLPRTSEVAYPSLPSEPSRKRTNKFGSKGNNGYYQPSGKASRNKFGTRPRTQSGGFRYSADKPWMGGNSVSDEKENMIEDFNSEMWEQLNSLYGNGSNGNGSQKNKGGSSNRGRNSSNNSEGLLNLNEDLGLNEMMRTGSHNTHNGSSHNSHNETRRKECLRRNQHEFRTNDFERNQSPQDESVMSSDFIAAHQERENMVFRNDDEVHVLNECIKSPKAWSVSFPSRVRDEAEMRQRVERLMNYQNPDSKLPGANSYEGMHEQQSPEDCNSVSMASDTNFNIHNPGSKESRKNEYACTTLRHTPRNKTGRDRSGQDPSGRDPSARSQRQQSQTDEIMHGLFVREKVKKCGALQIADSFLENRTLTEIFGGEEMRDDGTGGETAYVNAKDVGLPKQENRQNEINEHEKKRGWSMSYDMYSFPQYKANNMWERASRKKVNVGFVDTGLSLDLEEMLINEEMKMRNVTI